MIVLTPAVSAVRRTSYVGSGIGVVDGSERHADRIAGACAVCSDAPRGRHAVLEQGRRDEAVGGALNVHREVDGAGAAFRAVDRPEGRTGRQLVDVAAGRRVVWMATGVSPRLTVCGAVFWQMP